MPEETLESGYPETTDQVDAGLMQMLGDAPELAADETNQSDLSHTEPPAPEAPPSEQDQEQEPAAAEGDDLPPNPLDDLPEELGAEESTEAADETDETDEGEAEESEAEPAGSPGLVKQIKKLRKQRQEQQEAATKAEAEVTRLRQQLDQLTSTQPEPPKNLGEFAGIETEKDFKERMESLREAKRWLRKNPDGGDFKGAFVEGDQVETLMDSLEDALEVQAPAAREYLSQRREAEARNQQARNSYDEHCESNFGWLLDEDSPEHTTLNQAMADVPVLASLPQGKFWACLAVEGAKVMKARHQARQHKATVAKPKPKAAKAPASPKPTAAPARVSRSQAGSLDAMARYDKDPTVHNAESVLADMLG